MVWLLACVETGDSGRGEEKDQAPEDTGTGAGTAAGSLVMCGGGSEGEVGDEAAWSTAYAPFAAAGRVAILSTGAETDWLPSYLQWLGATGADNLEIASREAADAVDLSAYDAVFLKGGDQGEYYDLWNSTRLEEEIRSIHLRGGVVGGTSAGAMSMAQYALAGGMDYVSSDVLADATTAYLGDTDGGSGVHDDFLPFFEGATVDTHFSVRGRLGRLAGTMAEALDQGASDLVGVGIDECTCLTVVDRVGRVSGDGSVLLLRPGDSAPVREAGLPLVWTGLALDRLTTGWSWDFDAQVGTPPAEAEAIAPVAEGGLPVEGWVVSGSRRADEEFFAWVVERWPEAYALRAGTETPLPGAFGLMDAHDSEMRGVNDEVLFRSLYEGPGWSGWLVGEDGVLSREGDLLVAGGTMASMVVDASAASWRSLSPVVSVEDAGDGALHPAGLTGMKLHILHTPTDARGWDPEARLAR